MNTHRHEMARTDAQIVKKIHAPRRSWAPLELARSCRRVELLCVVSDSWVKLLRTVSDSLSSWESRWRVNEWRNQNVETKTMVNHRPAPQDVDWQLRAFLYDAPADAARGCLASFLAIATQMRRRRGWMQAHTWCHVAFWTLSRFLNFVLVIDRPFHLLLVSNAKKCRKDIWRETTLAKKRCLRRESFLWKYGSQSPNHAVHRRWIRRRRFRNRDRR